MRHRAPKIHVVILILRPQQSRISATVLLYTRRAKITGSRALVWCEIGPAAIPVLDRITYLPPQPADRRSAHQYQ